MRLKFSHHNFEKYPTSKFHKIRPVGVELFHAGGWTDGQTDTTNLIVAFQDFANAPKNSKCLKIKEPWKILNIEGRNNMKYGKMCMTKQS